MLSRLAAIDKVSLYSLGQMIGREEGVDSICKLAKMLGVPLMSEARNRLQLLKKVVLPGNVWVKVAS